MADHPHYLVFFFFFPIKTPAWKLVRQTLSTRSNSFWFAQSWSVTGRKKNKQLHSQMCFSVESTQTTRRLLVREAATGKRKKKIEPTDDGVIEAAGWLTTFTCAAFIFVLRGFTSCPRQTLQSGLSHTQTHRLVAKRRRVTVHLSVRARDMLRTLVLRRPPLRDVVWLEI